MTDLPEGLQTPYEALKYLFESTMAPSDAEDALADLEALVAPYRAAQRHYAGSLGPYRFLTAWSVWKASEPASEIRTANEYTSTAPTLMDLVLKAAEKQEDASE